MIKKLILFSVVSDVIIFDQLTKFLASRHLPLGEAKEILPFFSLTLLHNTGAAFGIAQGQNILLVVLTLVILAVLAGLGRGLIDGGWPGVIGLGLVAGGAVGNLIDRLARGHVVDFLDFHWRGWHWPAFNIADSAVCVGVALLVFFSSSSLPPSVGEGQDGGSHHPSPPPQRGEGGRF